MSALFKSFLRLLVRMRGALNSEAFDAGWEWNRPRHPSAGALDGLDDVVGRRVNDAVVVCLQANTNSLSSHRKNNCLLMVVAKSGQPAAWRRCPKLLSRLKPAPARMSTAPSSRRHGPSKASESRWHSRTSQPAAPGRSK